MSGLAKRLRRSFGKSREYRHAYAEGHLNTSLATQIKVLREQRGWTQERLAREAGMKQSTISRIEDVNYDAWSLKTLKRLARAFDVVLLVRFETFESLLSELQQFNRQSLERASFGQEPNQEPARPAYRHITCVDGVRSGHATVEGTRIGVHDVAGLILKGAAVDDVVRSFPALTRAQVYECMAYYEDHKTAVDPLIESQMAEADG